MNLSRKKRRWVSVGVGVVGLVTILGLSDLLFLIPREQSASVEKPIEPRDITPQVPVATSSEIQVPLSVPTTTTTTPQTENEFKL